MDRAPYNTSYHVFPWMFLFLSNFAPSIHWSKSVQSYFLIVSLIISAQDCFLILHHFGHFSQCHCKATYKFSVHIHINLSWKPRIIISCNKNIILLIIRIIFIDLGFTRFIGTWVTCYRYDVSVMESVRASGGPLLVEIERAAGTSLGISLTSPHPEPSTIIIETIRPASIAERWLHPCLVSQGTPGVGDHLCRTVSHILYLFQWHTIRSWLKWLELTLY